MCYYEEWLEQSAPLFAINRVRLLLSRLALPRGRTPSCLPQGKRYFRRVPKGSYLAIPLQRLGSKLELTPEDEPCFILWEICQLGCTLCTARSLGQLKMWLAARRQMGPVAAAVAAAAALLQFGKTWSSGNCGLFFFRKGSSSVLLWGDLSF